jgi:hypothetical protein
VGIHDHALDHLRYIRSTMERAGAFTAVPGRGGVAVGVLALAAAYAASIQPTRERWLAVWLVAATLAFLIGFVTMRAKARAAGTSLLSPAGRKFALAFAPPVIAGAVLTIALWRAGSAALLPGTWLCCYGVAVMGAGAFSVSVVPLTGAAFMLFGGVGLLAPELPPDLLLAAGFGGLHVVSGTIIARRFGG